MRKRMFIIVATVLLAVLALVLVLYFRPATEEIGLDEANKTVNELYGGEVQDIFEEGNYFQVKFTRAEGSYVASVNRENGQVEKLELLEQTETAKELPEDEARTIAAGEVEGTVGNIFYSEERNEYEVEVESGEEISTVILSAQTGEVRRISTETVEQEPDPLISSEEAVTIAKTVLDGTVDELEFQQTKDGGFYLIDIENDESDQEVRVQVHAIKGEIITVEWED